MKETALLGAISPIPLGIGTLLLTNENGESVAGVIGSAFLGIGLGFAVLGWAAIWLAVYRTLEFAEPEEE